jgi:membrane associated rhomboid family serine protease
MMTSNVSTEVGLGSVLGPPPSAARNMSRSSKPSDPLFPPSQASFVTRAKVWYEGIPLITRYTFTLCVGLHLVMATAGVPDLGAVCFHPGAVLHDWQLYRIVASSLFHVGFLHLFFNMSALVPVGAALERLMGSVQLLWLMLVLGIMGDAAYIATAYAAAMVPSLAGVMSQCAVGLSGVLFGLVVVDNSLSSVMQRSIFGLFSVPAKLYPWVLMVVWQLLVPQSSFLGHLSGVVIGQLWAWGKLKWMAPSDGTIQWLEASFPFACCFQAPGFIAYTGVGSMELPLSQPPPPQQRSLEGSTAAAGSTLTGIQQMLRGYWLAFPSGQDPWQPPAPSSGDRVGGSTGGGSMLLPTSSNAGFTPADPKAAAAAAAEARFAQKNQMSASRQQSR